MLHGVTAPVTAEIDAVGTSAHGRSQASAVRRHLLRQALQESRIPAASCSSTSRHGRFFSDAAADAPASSSSTKSDSPAPSAEVQQLVDAVCKLNVLEMAGFVDALKEKLNIPDSALMGAPVAVAAAPPPAADAAGGDAKEEKKEEEEFKSYTLKLKGYGSSKIKVIKVVREIFQLGLKEAKTLVDGAPCDLKKDLQKEEAEELLKKISEAGGELELV